ncbi:Man1-Src1p-C-terminal domain-containing protein [Thamnidium elegans]|nr:Man1-Src1p-C-terminal domain-containing protein [Thamnidium elegans]
MNTNPDIPNELYYLDERFSVRSLRKYQLKEILTSHNIPYLSNLTRVDLIDLFRKHIEPRREEILREYKQQHVPFEESETYGRGRRVSHKPKKYENTVSNYLDDKKTTKDADGFKIPSLPKRRVQPDLDEDDQTHTNVVKQKSMPVKAVNNLAKAIRSRFSPPPFSEEDSFASSGDDNDDTDEDDYRPAIFNEKKNQTTEAEKYSATGSTDTAANGNGRTDYYDEDDDEDDTDFECDSDVNDDDDDDDEELGPVDKEELVQLYKDQFVSPIAFYAAKSNTPNNNRRITTRSEKLEETKRRLSIWKARFKQALFIFCALYMIIGMIGFFITSYARQKNGYCQNYPKDINNTTPSTLVSMLPSPCIPCPDHGICSNGELECDALYQRKTPLYNIGHIFPIADDCVHNSVLGRYVHKVERKIKNYLAVRQGEAYCNQLMLNPDLNIQDVPMSRIPVKEIMIDLKEHLEEHLPADKLDQILLIGFSTILEDPKIHYWETDKERFLGTSRYKFSITCQIKRLYLAVPNKIKLYIIAFISVFTAIYGATKDYRNKKAYQQKIDKMVKSIVDQLKQQYDNHTKNTSQYPSPRLLASQLRSSIVDLNNSKTIADWQCVVKKAESHPHIKKSIEEVNGDIAEYWELTP